MRKVIKIELKDNHQIVCCFDNEELRVLDLSSTTNDKYSQKILSDETIFKTAKIGVFGEIYWSNIAEIKDVDGRVQSCNYDISPEFAYFNSTPIDKDQL